MKVGIIVVTYNISSEVFILQMQAIRKFCKDEDYIVEVVDNSTDSVIAENLRYHANEMGINYCKIFSASKNSSDSHAWAANFAYTKFKEKYEAMFFIDHDCIPCIMFSVEEILSGGHVIAGLGQGSNKTYFWAGLVMFSNDRIEEGLVDFSTNSDYFLDTGGNLYKVVEKYGKENCIFFNEAYHQNPYFNHVGGYNHYAMLADNRFMHFVNSSNWASAKNQEERINSLINIAKEKTGL